jgi:hypothetical protein
MIPYWRAPEPIPKRRKGPRVTSNIGNVEGLKTLDANPPNRKEPLFQLLRAYPGGSPIARERHPARAAMVLL